MLTPSLRLVSLLGKGGMGSVWRAEHLQLKKQVAVKLLATELVSDSEAHARFLREATLLAQLKSPHVVTVHDFGESSETPYFVMELLEGEDLGDRLERATTLPLGTVTAILAQLCKALDRIHEIGVVHRDLKPGNVFLTKVDGDLVVKLVDFGIAKNAQGSFKTTSTGALLGTPLYMSPEQVLSTKEVGPASDLYSLGVLVYECLAGEPPFSGETLGAIHVAITQGRFVPISKRVPGLHPALDAFFTRALAGDPRVRFESAREMAEAFMAASRGVTPASSPPRATLPSSTARMGSPPAASSATLPADLSVTARSRHSRRAALVVGVALVSGIGLAFAVASPRTPDATSSPPSASPSASLPPPASAAAAPTPPSTSAPAATTVPVTALPSSSSSPVSASPVSASPVSPSTSPPPASSLRRSPPPRAKKDRGF